jgi:hypothetical protein
MTVRLPSPGWLALALVLIAAVFVAGLAIGRSHRPPARNVAPPLPRSVQVSGQSPTVTVPSGAPAVPALKAYRLPVVIEREFRLRGVL